MSALSHLKVLDLTRVLAGPWCTQMLADFGAQVIKVERPGIGDETRHWGPPFFKDDQGQPALDAAYFQACNRNKRSVTLDLSTQQGQEIIRQLVAQTDVLIENYKVGQLAQYGLDYASLSALNPRLIYCSITGFGQDGPWADQAGYDFMIQGLSGMMSITGEQDGTPQKVGVAISDLMTGTYSAVGILAALAHRERTGLGQQIDMALYDVMLATNANVATNYFATDKTPQRWGNAHPNIVPYQVFDASDGPLIVAAGNDQQYAKFVRVGAQEHLAQDERFKTNMGRVKHRAELVPLLQAMVAQHSVQWWQQHLNAAGVPCGPIRTVAQAFESEQAQHRMMQATLQHANGVKVKLPANPIKLTQTPAQYRSAPPLLGEHTNEVLGELGFTQEQIAQLCAQGIC